MPQASLKALVDKMEELGIVGPYEGAKPRQVTIDREGWTNVQRNLGLISGEEPLLPIGGASDEDGAEEDI